MCAILNISMGGGGNASVNGTCWVTNCEEYHLCKNNGDGLLYSILCDGPVVQKLISLTLGLT
jgi:hypothetical protein